MSLRQEMFECGKTGFKKANSDPDYIYWYNNSIKTCQLHPHLSYRNSINWHYSPHRSKFLYWVACLEWIEFCLCSRIIHHHTAILAYSSGVSSPAASWL
jgi:hypothetical protein